MENQTVTGYTGQGAKFTSWQQLNRWKDAFQKETAQRKRFEKSHNIYPFKGVSSEELENAKSYYGKRQFPLADRGSCLTVQRTAQRAFDRILHLPPDYNPKYRKDLHGVMRQSGINARIEDDRRVTPVLVNNVYSHRRDKPLEPVDRTYGRALVLEQELGTCGVQLGEAPR